MNSPIELNTSQKLIRCTVASKNKPESLRYIEFEHYKLWSYMMLHKHGIKIKEASLWLWVRKQDVEEKKTHYSHFPFIEQVNKIELFLFDEWYGFTHTIHRYVPVSETNLLEKILISHISPEVVASGNYELKTHLGSCIQSGKNVKNMILGLSNSDDRIWFRRQ